MHRLWHSQEGQALPLIVLFLLVLMGVVALVIDGGNGFAQRRRMQNAADAAAISGAITIVKGETRDAIVRQVTTDYAVSNGADSAGIQYLDSNGNVLPDPADGKVPLATDSLRVTTQHGFPTFFARLLGFSTMAASAHATAKGVPGAPYDSMDSLAPMSVPTNFYASCGAPTDSCDIWDSQFAKAWNIPAAQYKTLIDLSKGTASSNKTQSVTDWTYGGYPGDVVTNDWLPVFSGDMGANAAAALRQRIIDYPVGVDSDGVIWGTVDMVIWDGFQNNAVHVAKFGRFKVRMTDVYGSHGYGHFIDYVVPGHTRGVTSGTPGPTVIVLGE